MSSTGTHRRALRWGGLTEAHAALRRLRHVPPSPGGASRQLAPRCGSPADPPAALYLAQDVKSVAWHPHGEVLVSASYDDSIKLWVLCDDDWICAQTLSSEWRRGPCGLGAGRVPGTSRGPVGCQLSALVEPIGLLGLIPTRRPRRRQRRPLVDGVGGGV